MKIAFSILPVLLAINAVGQNTFPSSGNVGIGTTSPGAALEVIGNISLPSNTGNKSIYMWSATDANWRIGTSASPGFTTSMATSYVSYISYFNGTGQGLALGVNGGQSSFEITGVNHNAFFRGNVGIGTTTPNAKLEVYSPGTTGSTLLFGGVIGSRSDGHEFNMVGGTPIDGGWTIQHGGQIRLGGSGRGDNDLNVIQFIQNGVEKMRLNNGGNFGIGTTVPELANHIVGGTGFPASSGTTQTGILRLQGTGSNGVLDFSINGGSGATLQVSNRTNLALNYSLILNPNGGNVGIGTTSPDARLAVSGQVHATEVKVSLAVPGPDYVFDKNYKLLSLSEIKSYIEQHKHLPEVPSAAEMEKNGIQLGEMNMLLLKKVEELTLLMIEQNKRIDDQQKEINELKSSATK